MIFALICIFNVLLICKTNRKSERLAVLFIFGLTDRSFVRFSEEISSLGFVIFLFFMGEKSCPSNDSKLKIFTGFFAIYSRVLVRGLRLFEFGEILAFILFHFESDLLGGTSLPNGFTKFHRIRLCLILPVL